MLSLSDRLVLGGNGTGVAANLPSVLRALTRVSSIATTLPGSASVAPLHVLKYSEMPGEEAFSLFAIRKGCRTR
jgi:hypothetical protein